MNLDQFQNLCLRIAELRGQNEWFTEADKQLSQHIIGLMPASANSPDRMIERGPRRIAVKTRKSDSSFKMRSGGYDRLQRDFPGVYAAVVTRKLPGEPKPSLRLTGKSWREHSEAVKASVEPVDLSMYTDPWRAAEYAAQLRKFKRENGIENDRLRAEAVEGMPYGLVWQGTGWSVKVFETSGEGTRSCDYEKLREMAPDVFSRFVEEKPGQEFEYLDLRHINRKPWDTDLTIDGAPDSAAASHTGRTSAVAEEFFRG